MARIAILGAGLGGTILAYELKGKLGKNDTMTVINKGSVYSFVPSNPWVAVGWRARKDITVDLKPVMAKRGIVLKDQGAKRVHPDQNQVELTDGSVVDYDYLVIATGPDLAFDEIPGLGPHGNTDSVCEVDHALSSKANFDRLVANPGPVVVGAAQGASCFGPAYEYVLTLDTALRRARVRDRVPMTFITPEPYVGHLGLDGVGDTKGMVESVLRDHHIKWITNARITRVEPGKMFAEEVNDDGTVKMAHELPFNMSMILPPFRGVPAVFGLEGLTNPRGFIIVDKHQRNPRYPNVFALGVCVAIPPMGKTPVPVGVPKTGFMIESMSTAITANIDALIKGRPANAVATWNAICLADFGDSGLAFIAQPQIPPRNVNWSSEGKWVHLAKIGFEKYFLHKIRRGHAETFYENLSLKMLGIDKLKQTSIQP
ncbi:MAG: NAD(P)/FAD-dependent oxidoreductase [Hyphomicrobiales bacterium]|nr:NAD(P)/FAD-dependent oxidoreductase [Hyphomicrobiales bacterium]